MNKPRLEFPCKYPIKVIGYNVVDLDIAIVQVFNKYLSTPIEGHIKTKLSGHGKYISMTIIITAESEEQLKSIHTELKQNDAIILIL